MGQNRVQTVSNGLKRDQNGVKMASKSKWQEGLFGSILAILRASWIQLSIFWGPPLPTIVNKKKKTRPNSKKIEKNPTTLGKIRKKSKKYNFDPKK